MKIYTLISLISLLALPLYSQTTDQEEAISQQTVGTDNSLNALTQKAEVGDIEATRQLYSLYALQGQTELAKNWASRYEQQLTQQADAGDVKAMMLLATAYLKGQDYMPQDTPQAVTWFTRAAEAGQASAAYILGEIFTQQGNAAEAERFYQQAWTDYGKLTQNLSTPPTDEQRNALYWQGYMQLMGIGTAKDATAGVAKLAQADNEWAWRQLYSCYIKGIGVQQDLAKGISYAKRLADETNDGLMAWVVATAYLEGKGLNKDIEKGHLYLDLATKANIAQAIYHKGTLLLEEGKSAEAWRFFNQAASMGLPEAMTAAARLLLYGAEGVEKDEARGLQMLQSAAQRYDDPRAPWELGQYYDRVGEPELANDWYRMASERGVVEAMARRGLLHITPNSGLNWSPTQMYRWWKTGSDAGDTTCSLYLNLFLFVFIPVVLILAFGVPMLVVHLLNKKALKEEAESLQKNADK